MDIIFMGRCVEINIINYTPYRPAKLFGLPEDCYPEEGPEVEFELSEDNAGYEFLESVIDRFDLWDELEEIILDEIGN